VDLATGAPGGVPSSGDANRAVARAQPLAPGGPGGTRPGSRVTEVSLPQDSLASRIFDGAPLIVYLSILVKQRIKEYLRPARKLENIDVAHCFT
jgi:hypothetical protein